MRPTEEAYQELQLAFDHFNQALFAGKLPPCLITFQREKQTCGYFSPARFVNQTGNITDEIALNPAYFSLKGLQEIMQTLVHEMCHLWQYHFGQPSRKCYHNKEWADKMQQIGLMPSDTGLPGGKMVGQKMADYALEGGAFLQACQTLFAKPTFTISWFDRHKPRDNPTYSMNLSSLGNLQAALNATPNRAELAYDLAETKAFAGIVSHQLVSADWLIDSNTKKPTRLKYTCACSNNIWGKPGLKIMCHECGHDFIAEDTQISPSIHNKVNHATTTI